MVAPTRWNTLRHSKHKMVLYDTSEALMCQAFLTTLRRPTRMWYSSLRPSSIRCFDQLSKEFKLNFLAIARHRPLAQFIARFAVEIRGMPDVHPSLIREKGLLKAPNPMKTHPEEWDRRWYCRFHRDYSHDCEECHDLENQMEDLT
ncbi:hypothetical protein B296_00028522 [Ensete ventricosum]|uniref:Retrotransposon gag domain-containing protein n=1 Tax=Ensete ventricosum TaxID=4639 RepID=A0A426ZS35_ENSVE|nr:hypothetical protein B296_00028522 [Ensete ventricosum]